MGIFKRRSEGNNPPCFFWVAEKEREKRRLRQLFIFSRSSFINSCRRRRLSRHLLKKSPPKETGRICCARDPSFPIFAGGRGSKNEGFDEGIGQRIEMHNSDIEIGETQTSKDETGADGENRVWMIAFLQRRRRRRGCHLLRDERIVRCCCFGSLVISCRKRKMQGGCQICLNRPLQFPKRNPTDRQVQLLR